MRESRQLLNRRTTLLELVGEVLAQVRAETYEEYAWPGPLAGLFKRNGTVVSLVAALPAATSAVALTTSLATARLRP